jgi:CHAD domain-containing protein
MPVSNLILRHWKKQQQIFLHNHAILKKQIDPEAIHDLRVAIKKLRSYLKLYVIICEQADWKTDFSETEKLFSILGKYRDVEMNYNLVAAYADENLAAYPSLLSHFSANLRIAADWVRRIVDEYESDELKAFSDKLNSGLSKFTNNQIQDEIQKIIREDLKKAIPHFKKLRENTHEVRKHLKDIFYWLELCPPEVIYSTLQRKKLHKILDGLGDWQDNEVLLIKVKHFRKDYMAKEADEYNDLKQLEKFIKNKKGDLLNNIENKMKTFLKDPQRKPPAKTVTKNAVPNNPSPG